MAALANPPISGASASRQKGSVPRLRRTITANGTNSTTSDATVVQAAATSP